MTDHRMGLDGSSDPDKGWPKNIPAGEHNACGTPDCCGSCDPLSDALDEIEAQSVRELLPAGAEAMWDHIAADSPQYIAPWDDQDDKARQVFTAAFEVGLATMAAIADGADDR